MSILSALFGERQESQPDQTTQPQQQTQPAAVPNPNERVIPGSGVIEQKPDPINEFSKFSSLFAPVDPDKAPKRFDPSSLHDLSNLPELLQEQNYLANTPKEELEAVMAGGEGAINALASIINRAGRTITAQAITASSKMVENGVSKTLPEVNSLMESHLRNTRVQDELMKINPIFKEDALKPMVEGLKSQVLTKFPQATAPEVAEVINAYFSKLQESMGGKDPASTTAQVQTMNWANFMSA